jgi:hypothetical protein
MGIIRDIYKFVVPPRRWRGASRILANDRQHRMMDIESQLAMRYGVARDEHHAKILFDKYRVGTARELWKILGKRESRWQILKRRAKLLLQRIDGHDDRDLIGYKKTPD